jgi:hypothetical protein
LFAHGASRPRTRVASLGTHTTTALAIMQHLQARVTLASRLNDVRDAARRRAIAPLPYLQDGPIFGICKVLCINHTLRIGLTLYSATN